MGTELGSERPEPGSLVASQESPSMGAGLGWDLQAPHYGPAQPLLLSPDIGPKKWVWEEISSLTLCWDRAAC